jgi:hypothetical protein
MESANDLSGSMMECLRTGLQSLSSNRLAPRACSDEFCRVAFWIELDLRLPYRLIIEFSKLGKFARAYWKRKSLISVRYLSSPPPGENEGWDLQLEVLEKILSRCGVILLSSNELDEEITLERDQYNPDDTATVGSFLFAPEYH